MRSLLGSELKNSVDQRASIAAKLNLEADNPRVKTVFAALKWYVYQILKYLWISLLYRPAG